MLLLEILTEKKYTAAISLGHIHTELPAQAFEPKKKSKAWFDRLFIDPDRDKPEYGMEKRGDFAMRVMRDLKKKDKGDSALARHVMKSFKKHAKKEYKTREEEVRD